MSSTKTLAQTIRSNPSTEQALFSVLFPVLMDTLSFNFFAIDKEGNYLARNSALTEIVGETANASQIDKAAWKSCLEVMESATAQVVEEYFNERWYLSVKSPLYGAKKEVIGVVGFAIDITERKETEQLKLEIAKKTEENAEAIKALAGTMAHEIRTPIASIKISIRYIKQRLTTLLNGYKKYIKTMSTPSDKLSSMEINNIAEMADHIETIANNCSEIVNLQLSNIRGDTIKQISSSRCNMQAIITSALKEYPFEDKDMSLIHYELDKFKAFEFDGDEMLLKHLLWNLLQNALYYLQVAGKGKIYLWPEESQEYNILHFKDTGMGMSKEVAQRAFEQFFTNRLHGTGLGLAFCKRVMKAMGGNIECITKEKEFTHFTLYFPKIKS